MKLYTHVHAPWSFNGLEVDTHAFTLKYIGTPVWSERSSDAENTQCGSIRSSLLTLYSAVMGHLEQSLTHP